MHEALQLSYKYLEKPKNRSSYAQNQSAQLNMFLPKKYLSRYKLHKLTLKTLDTLYKTLTAYFYVKNLQIAFWD